jgi:hypothetical protein
MGNMWQILKDNGIEKAKRNLQIKIEFQCDQIIGSKVMTV